MITKKGLSLGFPLEEVNEYKKTSRGVKGISLSGEDEVSFAAMVTPEQEIMTFDGKDYNVRKIKMRKRADKPQKAQIL